MQTQVLKTTKLLFALLGTSTLAAAQSDPAPTSYPYRKGVAPVGIQLVLAMDTSSSMTDEEFKIELQATAAALNAAGHRVTLMPEEGADSESLLALPQLSDLHGFAVVVITNPTFEGHAGARAAALELTLARGRIDDGGGDTERHGS